MRWVANLVDTQTKAKMLAYSVKARFDNDYWVSVLKDDNGLNDG